MMRARRSMWTPAAALAAAMTLIVGCSGPTSTPSPSRTPAPAAIVGFDAAFRTPGDHALVAVVAWDGGLLGVATAPDVRSPSKVSAEVIRSADGLNWSVVDTATALRGARPLALLARADGLLLLGAVDPSEPSSAEPTSAAFFSTDGKTWTKTAPEPMAADTLTAVAGSTGVIVAIGRRLDRSAAVWTSRDGRGWTRSDLGGDAVSATLSDVATVAGRIVIVGATGPLRASDGSAISSGLSTPTAWSSADGAGWQRAVLEAPGDGSFASSVFATPWGVFTQTGFGAGAWTMDGVTWAPRGSKDPRGPLFPGTAACSATRCLAFAAVGWPSLNGGPPEPVASGQAGAARLRGWVLDSPAAWQEVAIEGPAPEMPTGDVGKATSAVFRGLLPAGDRFIAVGYLAPHPVYWLLTLATPSP